MVNTVRKRILDEVKTRIGATPSFGLVRDAADILAGETPKQIAKALAEGKFVHELLIMDDVGLDPQDAFNLDAWSFDVFDLITIPDSVIAGGRTPYDVAADIHAEVYRTYADAADPGGKQSWGGLAESTTCIGGGGIAIAENGMRETVSAFRIKYRHAYGDPATAV